MHRVIVIGLLSFLLIYAHSVTAQNEIKADSLRKLLESRSLQTQEKLDAYDALARFSGNPAEKLKYGNLLLQLANETNNLEFKIKAKCRIGVANRYLGNLDIALKNLFESAELALADKQFTQFLAEVYAEISTCYTQNGDSENALFYGSKTISILRNSDERRQELALSLLNTGYDYYLIGNYDSAKAYYNESEPILEEIEMTIGLAYIKGNRALVYWKEGDTERAKKDLNLAIDMLRPFGDQYGMADYYNQLGAVLMDEGKNEEAIASTLKALDLAISVGFKEQVRDASKLLSELYEQEGDYQKASAYQTTYYAYKDSIQNLETTQRLADLRTAFEVGQKQSEVDLLLAQKRINRIIMITGGVILLTVICLVVIIYSYFKSKSRLSSQLEAQKDSLITLNETKDKFFSIISHDLRGPVSTLYGLVSVSRNYAKEGKTEEVKDMVERMGGFVDRLTKLLDDLLSWAMQQRGHFPYTPESLSLQTMLDDVIDMFVDMAKSKDIQIDFQMEDDISLMVDKNSTSTIFRNLINNAIKFTNSGGRVQIKAFKDGSGSLGVIKVIDNGVGIPKEKLDKLFELNENISTKGTSGEIGLGLGLQLVCEFVQINKGKIEVESELNVGTAFTIKLPLGS